MFRLLTLLCLFFVAGCTSPSPSMFGGASRDVEINGSRFKVYTDSAMQMAEAHRISFEPLPGLVHVYSGARQAIIAATGCDIVDGSMRGDQAIVLADLSCPAADQGR